MENGEDPPGTRRSASGRLIDCKTGRFAPDPNKVKRVPSSRRASSRRSAASEKTADRSRSIGEGSENGQQEQHQHQVVGLSSTTLPDSATGSFDVGRRLRKKTSMVEYEQVQAQLRKGDPIPVRQVQDQTRGNHVPPLLTFLTQGRE
eukprot:2092483-Amphidinium_carterae.1